MLSYTAFRDSVEATVQDSSNVNFSTTELDTFIAQACREAGRYVPHAVRVSFTIESRFGVASSTSASNLVDATKSQFVSGDVGKVVRNITDNTWAVITTYTSATSVVLSNDIMAANENYEIYNAGCTRTNEVSLVNIDDYLDIEKVEYPIGTNRNWEIDGNTLSIKVDYIPDSRVLTSGVQPETEVLVWFKKRHLISQLTDLLGAVNNAPGYAAGSTSMAVNSLQATGTIEAGQEFTIASTRGTYTVTADASIAGNAATISFFPGLESTVAHTTVITFTGSTLTPTLEPLVIELAAALAAASKPMSLYQHAFTAVTAVALATTAIAAIAARITQAITDIASGRTSNTNAATAITLANAEFDLMNPQIDLAVTALSSANGLVNTIPVGGGAAEYMGQASSDVGVGSGYFNSGRQYLLEAASDEQNAATLLSAASHEIQAGTAKMQEANASVQKAGMELQISNNGRNIESWSRNQLNDTRAKLRRMVPNKYRTSRAYSRA